MTSSPSNSQDNFDPLEELLAKALSIIETEGQSGLKRFLDNYPSEEIELRKALEALDQLQLLEQRPETIPGQFDDFVIKQELGKGGMGVVFVAEQQSLRREVALKIIRPELLLFAGARERFRREIESVARLEHPAIIPILATGTDNDIPYYAMPRLRGRDAERVVRTLNENPAQQLRVEDLRKAIDDRCSTSHPDTAFGANYWQAVVRLIYQAALGIEHAHLRGVLHRDLKPSNIFFTTTGQAVVLDFGLARAGEDPRLTRSGAAAGSPAYMAPEQVRGESADERTDVYGLGATLHCVLGLRPPFGSDSTEAMRNRILAGERMDLRHKSALPPELLLVLDCALDVDRLHRYPSAQQFADDLLAVVEGRKIRARKLPRRVRMQRLLQRHPTMSSVAAMAFGFVLLLPAVLLWQEQEASRVLAKQVEKTRDINRDLEEANRELANQALLAEQNQSISLDAVGELLSGVSTEQLRHHIGAQPIILEMLQKALALFDKLPREQSQSMRLAVLRLETMSKLSSVHTTMGKPRLGEQLIDEGLAWMAAQDLPNDLLVFKPRFQLLKASLVHNRNGNEDDVVSLVHTARKTLTGLVLRGSAKYSVFVKLSDALVMCGHIATQAGDEELAEENYRAAIEAAHYDDGTSPVSACKLVTRLELARFYRTHLRYDEALHTLELLMHASSAARTAGIVTWPRPEMMIAHALNEKHVVLAKSGHIRASLAPLHQAIRTYDELIPDYRDLAELWKERGRAKGNLGVALTNWGHFDEAIQWTRSAIIDQEQALKLTPGLHNAEKFLQNHRLLLTICLRGQEDWPALEIAARQLSKMRLPANRLENAACDLLRCSHHVTTRRAKQLRATALAWLAVACKGAYRLGLNDAVYDCIRTDPQFLKLR